MDYQKIYEELQLQCRNGELHIDPKVVKRIIFVNFFLLIAFLAFKSLFFSSVCLLLNAILLGLIIHYYRKQSNFINISEKVGMQGEAEATLMLANSKNNGWSVFGMIIGGYQFLSCCSLFFTGLYPGPRETLEQLIVLIVLVISAIVVTFQIKVDI